MLLFSCTQRLSDEVVDYDLPSKRHPSETTSPAQGHHHLQRQVAFTPAPFHLSRVYLCVSACTGQPASAVATTQQPWPLPDWAISGHLHLHLGSDGGAGPRPTSINVPFSEPLALGMTLTIVPSGSTFWFYAQRRDTCGKNGRCLAFGTLRLPLQVNILVEQFASRKCIPFERP